MCHPERAQIVLSGARRTSCRAGFARFPSYYVVSVSVPGQNCPYANPLHSCLFSECFGLEVLAPYCLDRSHCWGACVVASVAVAVAANNSQNPYHEERGNDCRFLGLVRLDMPDCHQPDPPIECPSSTPGEYATLMYPVGFAISAISVGVGGLVSSMVDGAPA